MDARSHGGHQRNLFDLFDRARAEGIRFAKISEVDGAIAAAEPVLLLKHDVHGLSLDALLAFAAREAQMGIRGTYLFMPRDHPVTARHFDFPAQLEAMEVISELGHELGLHVDPYFQIHQKGRPFADCLREIMDEFAAGGIKLRVGNMHGNSRHKHPDRDGYGTMFDLIEEIGRQPDFPALAAVPEESAALIRANRIRARDFGFTHWGDMPVWSARNGFIVTNFMTDNQLGKQGTIEVLTRSETRAAYLLADRQPPGSRNLGSRRTGIATPAPEETARPVHERMTFDQEAPRRLCEVLTRGGLPMLFLVHPEHYC
jgi:hypothetical protein